MILNHIIHDCTKRRIRILFRLAAHRRYHNLQTKIHFQRILLPIAASKTKIKFLKNPRLSQNIQSFLLERESITNLTMKASTDFKTIPPLVAPKMVLAINQLPKR